MNRQQISQRLKKAAMLTAGTAIVATGTITSIEINGFETGINIGQSAIAGKVPANLTEAINDSKKSAEALQGLAYTALTVALVPLGSMMALRFLNMVLSRI